MTVYSETPSDVKHRTCDIHHRPLESGPCSAYPEDVTCDCCESCRHTCRISNTDDPESTTTQGDDT